MSASGGTGGADVVRTYIEIMNSLDLDAFGALVTDDVVVRLPYAPDPVPKVTEGKAGVVGLYGGFPSLVSPLGFHVRGDRLAAFTEYFDPMVFLTSCCARESVSTPTPHGCRIDRRHAAKPR